MRCVLKRISASFCSCLSNEIVFGLVLGNDTHFLLEDSVPLGVFSVVEEFAHQVELFFEAESFALSLAQLFLLLDAVKHVLYQTTSRCLKLFRRNFRSCIDILGLPFFRRLRILNLLPLLFFILLVFFLLAALFKPINVGHVVLFVRV